MKTTYQKDGRLPQHTAVGNDDTPITYPTSPHEWMSVKAVEEKDAEIERLTAALGQCSQARAELLETLRRMKE